MFYKYLAETFGRMTLFRGVLIQHNVTCIIWRRLALVHIHSKMFHIYISSKKHIKHSSLYSSLVVWPCLHTLYTQNVEVNFVRWLGNIKFYCVWLTRRRAFQFEYYKFQNIWNCSLLYSSQQSRFLFLVQITTFKYFESLLSCDTLGRIYTPRLVWKYIIVHEIAVKIKNMLRFRISRYEWTGLAVEILPYYYSTKSTTSNSNQIKKIKKTIYYIVGSRKVKWAPTKVHFWAPENTFAGPITSGRAQKLFFVPKK